MKSIFLLLLAVSSLATAHSSRCEADLSHVLFRLGLVDGLVSMDDLPRSERTCGPVSAYNGLVALAESMASKSELPPFDVCQYFASHEDLGESTSVKLVAQTRAMAKAMGLDVEVSGLVQAGTEAHKFSEYRQAGLEPVKAILASDLVDKPNSVRVMFIYWHDTVTDKFSGHAVLLRSYVRASNELIMIDPNNAKVELHASFKQFGNLNSVPVLTFAYKGATRPETRDVFIPYGIMEIRKQVPLRWPLSLFFGR